MPMPNCRESRELGCTPLLDGPVSVVGAFNGRLEGLLRFSLEGGDKVGVANSQQTEYTGNELLKHTRKMINTIYL